MNRSLILLICFFLFIQNNVAQVSYLDCGDCTTEITACENNNACNTVKADWDTCTASEAQCENGVGQQCVEQCGPQTANTAFDDLLLCVKQNCDTPSDFNVNDEVDFTFLPWFLGVGSDFTDISYGVNCMNDCHSDAAWVSCNNDLDCQLNRTSYWNCVIDNYDNLSGYIYGDFTNCDEQYWVEGSLYAEVLDCYNNCFVPFLTQCDTDCSTEVAACQADNTCSTIYDDWNTCQTDSDECPKGTFAVRTTCIEDCGDFENEQFADLGLCVFNNCNQYLDWGQYQSDAAQLCVVYGDCSSSTLDDVQAMTEVANCAQDCEDNSGCWDEFECQVKYRDFYGCYNQCYEFTEICDLRKCFEDCTVEAAGSNQLLQGLFNCYWDDCSTVELECMAKQLQSFLMLIAILVLFINLI